MVFSSSNLRNRLAPRCRLITSLYWRWHKGFDCSSIKVVRELGLERREPVWSLSTVKKKEMVFVLLREDRTIFTSCYLNIIRNCYVNTREQMKAYKHWKLPIIFLETEVFHFFNRKFFFTYVRRNVVFIARLLYFLNWNFAKDVQKYKM